MDALTVSKLRDLLDQATLLLAYPPAHDGGFSFVQRGIALPDGRFSIASWNGSGTPSVERLSRDGLLAVAAEFEVPASNIQAFLDVESTGSGFLEESAPPRPRILFEAHQFYKLTPLPVSKVRPDLSSKKWDRSLYKGGAGEWDRLRDAISFDPVQAIKSASWGIGQIMGFNYAEAGCATLGQFICECFASEVLQLRHAMQFIARNHLLDPLRRERWDVFARGYNGPGYRENRYDAKLAAADDKAEKAGLS